MSEVLRPSGWDLDDQGEGHSQVPLADELLRGSEFFSTLHQDFVLLFAPRQVIKKHVIPLIFGTL